MREGIHLERGTTIIVRRHSKEFCNRNKQCQYIERNNVLIVSKLPLTNKWMIKILWTVRFENKYSFVNVMFRKCHHYQEYISV